MYYILFDNNLIFYILYYPVKKINAVNFVICKKTLMLYFSNTFAYLINSPNEYISYVFK